MDFKRLQRSVVGFFKKNPVTQPGHQPPSKPRAPRSLPEILQDLRDHIREQVAAGFLTESEIVGASVDYLGDESSEQTLRPHAERFTREELQAHHEQQKQWPAQTDCDRLDAAFAELEQTGIVARQNFTCCQTCGNDEIRDEVKAAKEQGRQPYGYTYYHMQDTESAVKGSGLYLAFAGKTDAAAVAKQIVETLQRHGLKPEWNGSLETRILIPLDWKRRR